MTCHECTETGRKGYRAPLRCYCGHETCAAFASWEPLRTPDLTAIRAADERMAKSWADREEPTWLDR